MGSNYNFSGDAVYVIASDTQAMAEANTHQELEFGALVVASTWGHASGSGIFTCHQPGRYICDLQVHMQAVASADRTVNARALFNSVEITGSHSGIELGADSEVSMLAVTFQFDGVDDEQLKIEIAGNHTAVQVTPGPNPGSAGSVVSARVNIWRIP